MEAILKKLHEALGAELLSRIESGDASPADLGVARQFLKDNGIDAIGDKNKDLNRIAVMLPFDQDQAQGE